jgi:hypothetical protein
MGSFGLRSARCPLMTACDHAEAAVSVERVACIGSGRAASGGWDCRLLCYHPRVAGAGLRQGRGGAIFDIAWETGSAHPGFLMIDSPQMNLGQGGHRDAQFADSVAVADFYKHLRDWLNGPGQGAQILVVDNTPPPSADDDVDIRFSRRVDQPPYGLIDDEVS